MLRFGLCSIHSYCLLCLRILDKGLLRQGCQACLIGLWVTQWRQVLLCYLLPLCLTGRLDIRMLPVLYSQSLEAFCHGLHHLTQLVSRFVHPDWSQQ